MEGRRKRFWAQALLTTLLVAATVAAFLPLRGNDFINYDDNLYLTANPNVQAGLTWAGLRWAFTALHSSNWHPLTWVSHMLDVQLFGLEPGPHHLVSLGLHAAGAVLLLLVLARMTGALWPSTLCAFLFALHPLRVESVAWAAERKDVLSVFFAVLTIGAYLRYVRKPAVPRRALVALLFMLALLAKPMVVTLPVLLLLLDYWPLGRFVNRIGGDPRFSPANAWPLLREKAPLFLLSAGSAVITYYAQAKGGAVSEFAHLPLPVRVANAFLATAHYLLKMMLPLNLSVFYPYRRGAAFYPASAVSFLVLGVATWAVLRLRERRPHLALGWGWYLVSLLPVIGLVQVGVQSMADRYTYLPLTGIFIIVAWSSLPVSASPRRRALCVLAALPLAVILGLLTFRQTLYWRNSFTLFEHAARVDPTNEVANANMSGYLLNAGDSSRALEFARRSVQSNPNLAEGRQQLAMALASRGEFEEAVPQYRAALKLNPRLSGVRYGLARSLARLGRREEAIVEYRAYLVAMPGAVDARLRLADLLGEAGHREEAIATYNEVLGAAPELPAAHFNLALVLEAVGRSPEALSHYLAAARFDPADSDARNNAAVILGRMGRREEALAMLREALRIRPDFAAARDNLARMGN